MKLMRYSQPVAIVTIQTGKKIDFIVPIQLAQILFWFLTCITAQVIILIAWDLIGDLSVGLLGLLIYLKGWQMDLALIGLAALLLLKGQWYIYDPRP